MCSLMMISDMLSKHVGAVKSVLKKWFQINDIQLVHLLVVWYLVNLQDARCNDKDNPQFIVYSADQKFFFCGPKRKKYSAEILRVATTICGAKFLKCVAEILAYRFCFCFLICVCVSQKSNILDCVLWEHDAAICLSATVFWNITPCRLVNNIPFQ